MQGEKKNKLKNNSSIISFIFQRSSFFISVGDIVKANVAVKTIIDKETTSIPRLGLSISAQQAVNDLAFHVSTFMNNELRGQRQSMQRSGLPSKSITSRLKGKDGRIRGSLMGKRVNFSARSVVSPDSLMDVDQVGVPLQVALKLTLPERVIDGNLERLRKQVRKGPHKIDGARTIIRNNITIHLEFANTEKEAHKIQIGDIVERYLQNDDIVLFNRQPSLHKGSMMAYRVRLMPHKTFRLNMAVTLPLNADCDGDELNVHVPQDEEAQTEARLLMAVPLQIVSPQANRPCIGFVQDAVIGAWLLTDDATIINRSLALELSACILHSNQSLCYQASYKGKDIYSLLFPGDLQYTNTRTGVRIEKGRLISGRLCKITLGASSAGLIHNMYFSYGPYKTAHFISDAQRLINRWLSYRGFSIRLSDCQPSLDTVEHVSKAIKNAEQKIEKILVMETTSTELNEEIEKSVSEIANKVLTMVGKVVHASLNEKENHLYQAVLCASKGNLINIAQLLGCIGQTSVEGHRIFVHDPQQQFGNKNDIASKGFVRKSYYAGLQSSDFFFHTMAGREGLIDTAVKTANTGYLQRRLMKAMETLAVAYDGTVRNSRDSIIQFAYGSDGFDATFIVKQSAEFLIRPMAELSSEFVEADEWEPFRNVLLEIRKQRIRIQSEISAVIFSPANIVDIILEIVDPSRRNGVPQKMKVHPRELIEAVNTLCTVLCPSNNKTRGGLELLIRWHLRCSNVIEHMTREELKHVLLEIQRRVYMAEVAPGEAVGPLAAQSISEPLTQLTLNTFHMAGVKSKNITLGVPRIKELIDLTKNMKTPSMRLVMQENFTEPKQLKEFKSILTYTLLGSIIKRIHFLEETDYFESSFSRIDQAIANRLKETSIRPSVLCPWVGRLELDAPVMIRKGLTPAAVAILISKVFPFHISGSLEHDEEWILKLRPIHEYIESSTNEDDNIERSQLQIYTETLVLKAAREVVLTGKPNISNCTVSEEAYYHLNAEGDIESKNRVVIDTHGGSLADVLSLSQFEANICISNDVHDVCAVLGIEAANAVLFDQIKKTLQFDGSYTNERHLMLLCSFCTHSGGLLPISRHGINRSADSGALSRASFEEVTDQLLEAALHNDVDYTTSFSPAIMVGQRLLMVMKLLYTRLFYNYIK